MTMPDSFKSDRRIVLRTGDVTSLEELAAPVFGRIVQLAQPRLVAHHSDLYHDARWIGDHFTAGRTRIYFRWAVDATGTAIGEDQRRRTDTYLLTVWARTGTGYLTIEEQP